KLVTGVQTCALPISEMALPALGPIRIPVVRSDPTPPSASAPAPDPAAVEKFLGPAPALPDTAAGSGASPANVASPGVPGAIPVKIGRASLRERAWRR